MLLVIKVMSPLQQCCNKMLQQSQVWLERLLKPYQPPTLHHKNFRIHNTHLDIVAGWVYDSVAPNLPIHIIATICCNTDARWVCAWLQ